MPTKAQIAAYLDQLLAGVDEHGWMVQGVMASSTTYGFAYTVGLTALGHPELVVIGFPSSYAAAVLNRLGFIVKNGKHTFAAGETVTDDALWQGDLKIHGPVVIDGDYPLRMAEKVYGAITALQVLWPDPEGRYADEPGADLDACSPMLGLAG